MHTGFSFKLFRIDLLSTEWTDATMMLRVMVWRYDLITYILVEDFTTIKGKYFKNIVSALVS